MLDLATPISSIFSGLWLVFGKKNMLQSVDGPA
jgi:hypothetical protein